MKRSIRGNYTSSSSKRVKHGGTSQSTVGRTHAFTECLTREAVTARKADDSQLHRIRLLEMTPAEREKIINLREGDTGENDNEWTMVHDMLDGRTPLDISHEGGEFAQVTEDMYIDAAQWRPKRIDLRTRRDRTERRTRLFNMQMSEMVSGYMQWCVREPTQAEEVSFHPAGMNDSNTSEGTSTERLFKIRVVDIPSVTTAEFHILPSDIQGTAGAFVRNGVLPCAPLNPTVAITIPCMELYRLAHLRSPSLSIQAWVHTLCDLHVSPFKRYLVRQFSIAYDVYLSIRAAVHSRVLAAVHRDLPDWRLKNCCPACTYRLKDERPLRFSMLYTMDGGNSLKRVLRRGPSKDDSGETLGPSSELIDTRAITGDYYIPRDAVNAHGAVVDPPPVVSAPTASTVSTTSTITTPTVSTAMLPTAATIATLSTSTVLSTPATLPTPTEEDPFDISAILDHSPCADRWENMAPDITKKMWGVYDETGIFISVCRHGFMLVLADMVRSGELAKYPLAVTEKLLNTFGKDLGGGYDIGCGFAGTLNRSSLGPLARELNHTSLVGAFHGHAHNRLCQLTYLAVYAVGLGLEDLEGGERVFSKSNPLARSLRYANAFHRQQAIATYFYHSDVFETYQNLTTFLLNNYKQALDILASAPTALAKAMQDLGVQSTSVFAEWRLEERAYLQGLKTEPLLETLEMEYWQKLVNYRSSQLSLDAAVATWNMMTSANVGKRDYTASIETERRNVLEHRDNDFATVMSLEAKLNITVRWLPESSEWKDTAKLVVNRNYQRALDLLEGLVVARMFELAKMNMSQTAYHSRKHIAKALQSRSQGIRTALDRYNKCAALFDPPRPTIKWEEVVEYAFLADFDLLRHSRQDVRARPWGAPAGRLAMDLHFRILRAQEEIIRLNVEIPRVATFIRDEDAVLCMRQAVISETDPLLAHQIGLYRMEHGRFLDHHTHRLFTISSLPKFSGSIECGTRASGIPGYDMNDVAAPPGPAATVPLTHTSLVSPLDVPVQHDGYPAHDLGPLPAVVVSSAAPSTPAPRQLSPVASMLISESERLLSMAKAREDQECEDEQAEEDEDEEIGQGVHDILHMFLDG